MNEIITRSPQTIAGEINEIKSQTSGILTAAYSYATRAAMEIGKRLMEVKALVPFGEWGKWLEVNVNYSETTAQNMMRIFSEFGDDQIDMITGKSKRDIFEKLSPSQLVSLFTLPEAERERIAETPGIEDKSSREIARMAKEIAEARERAEEAERKAEETRRVTDAKKAEAVRVAIEEVNKKAVEQTEKAVKAAKKESAESIKKLRKSLMEEEITSHAEKENAEKERAEREKLEKQLKDAQAALEKAEKQQAEKAVTEESERERKTWEEEIATLKKKLAAAGSAKLQKFAVHYEIWKSEFSVLVSILGEVQEEDTKMAEKMAETVVMTLDKAKEALGNG